MRDFLAATRDRVVVFDGGMGATLEQFELSLERDYQLPGGSVDAAPLALTVLAATLAAAGLVALRRRDLTP